MEPLYKGHHGTRHLVFYIEVVLSLEVQNVLLRYEVLHLGPFFYMDYCVLYMECPLREVSL